MAETFLYRFAHNRKVSKEMFPTATRALFNDEKDADEVQLQMTHDSIEKRGATV